MGQQALPVGGDSNFVAPFRSCQRCLNHVHHAPALHCLCNVQWSPAILARSMKIGPGIDQNLNNA